jgi:hypothetical protein
MLNKLCKNLLICLLSIIVCGGCSSGEVPTHLVSVTTTPYTIVSEQPNGKLGEKISTTNFYLTATEFEYAESYERQADTGYQYLAVEVQIESRVDNFEDYKLIYARLQDNDGHTYFASFTGKEPFFEDSGPLKKGAIVKGWITFQVPKNSGDFWLIYESPEHPEDGNIVIDLKK